MKRRAYRRRSYPQVQIAPRAVQAFLARAARDSNRIKQLPEEEVRQRVAKVAPSYATPMFAHQARCYLLGCKYPGYAFVLDPGLGKTKIALDLIRRRMDLNEIHRTLVLVPYASTLISWIDEAKKVQPSIRMLALTDDLSSADKHDAVFGGASFDVIVCTYAGWAQLACKNVKNKKTGKGKLVRINDRERVFDGVVFDESHSLKNSQSLTFRLARALAKVASMRLCLTGTPMADNPLDLWSQLYVVDGGETLGETLSLYRAAYFDAREQYFGGMEYKLRPACKDALHRRLRNRSIRFETAEAVDLPPKREIEIKIPMPAALRAYHDRVMEELRAARGNRALVDSAYLRLRQLAMGWLTIKDPDDDDQVLEFDANPKAAWVADWIADLPKTEKAVVFCVYKRSGAILERTMAARGINLVRLYGETKDKVKTVRRFLDRPNVQVLLASKSGSASLNLQGVCRYSIFAEVFDSPIEWGQAMNRIYRIGQTRSVYIYYPCMAVDSRILARVRSGKSLYDDLMTGGDL